MGLVKNSGLDSMVVPEEAQRPLQNEHFRQLLKPKSQPRSQKASPLVSQTQDSTGVCYRNHVDYSR